jgi:sRNA-binding protein
MAAKKPKKAAHAKRPAARSAVKRPTPRRPSSPAKASRAPAAKPTPKPTSAPTAPEPAFPPRNPDERRHVLSLSFVRDGDEFMARIETDSAQIIELKNRSLDQLLTLVASELEDLLE